MIFVDTGPLLARYLPSDQHHQAAKIVWNELALAGESFAITNLVVTEFVTLLVRRASSAFAAERARRLYASSLWTILRATEADGTQAIVLLEQLAGHRVGFVDCISFAMMRSRRLGTAFTFDAHFRTAGFEVTPE